MSMNLHLSATRNVKVVKTGKQSKQEIHFDLWQTPTVVTKEAIRGNDPKGVYADWVKSISEDVVEPVYDDDDVFDEYDPIGTRIVNFGKTHIEDLETWLMNAEDEGYDLEWYEL